MRRPTTLLTTLGALALILDFTSCSSPPPTPSFCLLGSGLLARARQLPTEINTKFRAA